MQLTGPAPADFGRRLDGPRGAPVAVAVSGGGDSMALMLMAHGWASGAGRPLVALTVDHGLQPRGADWTRCVAERAGRLGVRHLALRWDGPKPATGLPAAARDARHALIAQAARQAGASVVLLGHTADDVLEAALMRRAGASTPTPRAWSPSPAWPEGRGVFLFRPLLGWRRAALREWLSARGEIWIEDPANDDPRYARARARRLLATGDAPAMDHACAPPARPCDLETVREGGGGDLLIPRTLFAGLPTARRLLAAACLCASGESRPPRGARLGDLLARLASGENLVATLAGARIEADAADVRFCREAGEFRRRATSPTALPLGESVFDGRFLLQSRIPGLSVRPLAGLAARLAKAERASLAAIPASVRGGLPAVVDADGVVSCPILAPDGPVGVQALPRERLLGALGAFISEAAFWRVAKTTTAP